MIPIVEWILNYPATIVILIVLFYIFYYVNKHSIDVEVVALNEHKLLDNKQYYRVFTAAFVHYDLIHILMNSASFWSLKLLEKQGIFEYMKMIVIIAIAAGFLDSIIRRSFLPDREVYSIGFSGVVCGLMTIMTLYTSSINFFGFNLPWSFAPFFYILLTQLIIPHASFIGHLSGVLVGFMYRWHFFVWISDKLFVFLLPWIVFLFYSNYAKTNRNSVSWFRVSRDPYFRD